MNKIRVNIGTGMSVLIETSEGDLEVDLFVDTCPEASKNFVKLCKAKYYNFNAFFNVQKNFACQSGDPSFPDKGDGGRCARGLVDRESRLGVVERHVKANRALEKGTLCFTLARAFDDDTGLAGSQFVITLSAGNIADQLERKVAAFGRVVEGVDTTLEKINNAFVDDRGRPLKDIRILHTYVLDDPFPEIAGLALPELSPEPSERQMAALRGWDVDSENEDADAREQRARDKEARAQALTLEIVGDLPFAEVKPHENVLFVCKLNPVTVEEDLELIFSRFGRIVSCEIIRDKGSGASLQYGFIEYACHEDCERAYLKMDGVLIDDSRIHVDFSQSVARMRGPRRARRRSLSPRGLAGGRRGGR